MTLPTHRQKDWDIALEKIMHDKFRNREPKMVHMHIYHDPASPISSVTKRIIPAGGIIVNKILAEMGMQKCKVSEATILIVVGNMTPSGCWDAANYKNYWVKEQ